MFLHNSSICKYTMHSYKLSHERHLAHFMCMGFNRGIPRIVLAHPYLHCACPKSRGCKMAQNVYRAWKVGCFVRKSHSLRNTLRRLLSSSNQDGPGLKEFITAAANNEGGHQLEPQAEGERVPYLHAEDTHGQGRKGREGNNHELTKEILCKLC